MANSTQYGAFVTTTNVWDLQQIQMVDVNSQEFKELLVRLYQNINNICIVLNIKDTGMYPMTEYVNGQLWFPNPNNSSATTAAANPIQRQVFRKVINFGALPNTATKSVAHGIICTAATSFTRIYATATDPVNKLYIPIPYASPVLANNIEINVDATNVNITTGSNRTAFTICYVVLEYIQS